MDSTENKEMKIGSPIVTSCDDLINCANFNAIRSNIFTHIVCNKRFHSTIIAVSMKLDEHIIQYARNRSIN